MNLSQWVEATTTLTNTAPKVYTHLLFGILVIAAEQIVRLLH
jgi:hypothetical protein